MSCNQVNILNYNHNVVKVSGDNFLTITNNNTCTSVTITQPVTNIIQVNSPGPQGPVGPKGADAVVGGDDMMIQYNSGSVLAGSPNLIFNYNTNTVILTGSLTVSSSNTFTNIGPAIFSGSVIVTDGITGSLYGTASWAENAITASYYNETDPIFNAASGGFTTTSSFNTFTSSYNTGSFTGNFSGSFSGSGADLFNIPASAIVGLNLSQIISGSVSASISPNGGLQVNTNVTAPSFTGSLQGTASWAENVISASYALTASYAANVPATASYALQALSASYALTASYVQNAQTASYVQNAQTASYVLQAVSASYALTASYISGSGGGSGAGFPYSGSAVITGSLLVTGSGLTVTGSTAISGTLTVNGIGVSLIKARRQDFVYPFSYCGTAPSGSAEASTVWTIVRINTSGSTDTIGTATNVAWTNRYSAIYV